MRKLILKAIDKIAWPILLSSLIFNIIIFKKHGLMDEVSYAFYFYYFILFTLYFIFKRLVANDTKEKIVGEVDKFENDPESITSHTTTMFEELRPYFLEVYKTYKSVDIEKETMELRVKKINDLAENLNEGLVLFDNDGNIDLINTSARKLLNIEHRAEIFGLEDEKIAENIQMSRTSGKDTQLEVRINDRDLKIFFEPIVELDGGMVVLIIDNSENKKLETMRHEFSANVTHELKSPLTSIIGYAELIEEGMAGDEENIKKFSGIIRKEADRLLSMIDDIIHLSRLDDEDVAIKMTLVDIGPVVDACTEKFKNMTDDKGLTVVNQVENFQIRTNESLFSDIITNIFENVIKYNKDGGKIEISSKLTDKYLKIAISDTGIGISKANIDRIFERFYVVDKSRSRNMKSTGLGLSIVKHICDYLNYDIKVESNLGEGTTFTIRIPRKMVIA